jgi:hypothetical protein
MGTTKYEKFHNRRRLSRTVFKAFLALAISNSWYSTMSTLLNDGLSQTIVATNKKMKLQTPVEVPNCASPL